MDLDPDFRLAAVSSAKIRRECVRAGRRFEIRKPG